MPQLQAALEEPMTSDHRFMSTSPPTILQVIPELDAGGAELTTLEVAEAITAAGGRALIATRGGRWVERARALGADVHLRDVETKNPLKLAANARWLRQVSTQFSVGLIHARSRAPAWSAEWAARRLKIPFVTTYHGAYSEKGPMKRAYNAVMARGDITIANSNYIRDLIKSRYGTSDEKLVVIERGVDLVSHARSSVAANRLEALRQAWGSNPDSRLILHPARLTRWKGQTTVIAAVALLPEEVRAETRVILAGDAQGRNDYVVELEGLIERHNLSDVVRIVGHVSDMPAAYALSDVVLIASTDPEAFGRTSAEAQAMGVPVIATAIGAPRDTVLAPPATPAGDRTGWLVPPGDPTALATAIVDAANLSPADRQELSHRAATHARLRFSTEKLQASTLSVYDRLIGSKLAPTFEKHMMTARSAPPTNG